MTQIHNHVN